MARRKRESGIEREDPGGPQGALSGGNGPGSWEGPRASPAQVCWSGQRVGRKAKMVERGQTRARGWREARRRGREEREG